MTAIDADAHPVPASTKPQIYLACPLTGVSPATKRQLHSDVDTVQRAIERTTGLDRIDDESWPLSVYAPIQHTPPWISDGRTPSDVFRINLDAVHSSDALIVLAEAGGSAGVGQEIEWATRLNLPVLYLCAGSDVSRQIQGAPAFMTTECFNGDAATLESKITHFLQRWKPLILDGPRRRASRSLRFQAVTLRLRGAWQQCPDRTETAAQIGVDLRYLELALSDPRYIAVMAVDTLLTLAYELGVSLRHLDPGPTFTLPVPMLRPLFTAAGEDGWSDKLTERLIIEGRAALQRGDETDLTTKTGWRHLRTRVL